PPTACSSSAICREVRVVVPSLTVSARSSVMPSASRGSAAVPPRTASTAAIRGNPGRFTTQTTRPFGSLDCAIAGTGSGLSSPKGGRSLGRGFFSAARSGGVVPVERRLEARVEVGAHRRLGPPEVGRGDALAGDFLHLLLDGVHHRLRAGGGLVEAEDGQQGGTAEVPGVAQRPVHPTFDLDEHLLSLDEALVATRGLAVPEEVAQDRRRSVVA